MGYVNAPQKGERSGCEYGGTLVSICEEGITLRVSLFWGVPWREAITGYHSAAQLGVEPGCPFSEIPTPVQSSVRGRDLVPLFTQLCSIGGVGPGTCDRAFCHYRSIGCDDVGGFLSVVGHLAFVDAVLHKHR